MDSILVRGNGPLKGAIPIAGAKNACLTLMPATLLSDEPLTLTNAPRLSDIKTMTHDGKPFGKFFFIEDPDGYKIEVLQRGGRFQ